MSRAAGVVLFCALSLAGCKRAPELKWSTGFWFWGGSSEASLGVSAPVDVLYFQAGTVHADTAGMGNGVAELRRDGLPAAREYWAVLRYTGKGVPAPANAPVLARSFRLLQADARGKGLRLSGIQLDVDSPTNSLTQYAAFLRAVKKELPAEGRLSITCLLDWFRSGTDVAAVLKQVDEFVPQFYDLQETGSYRGSSAIAAPFDAGKWGPIFNRYRKPFRIGISTFGRARFVPKDAAAETERGAALGDLSQLDMAGDPRFAVTSRMTPAKEAVLNYRAGQNLTLGYKTFHAGDSFEFVLPTADSIRIAVNQARGIHGYCAGVLFFRWPSFNETLTAGPEQVLAAAGEERPAGELVQKLRAVNGSCAAVSCVDLYLMGGGALTADPKRYRIRSSAAMEYYLPGNRLPAHMTGPNLIELTMPAYCGNARTYLGRAVTLAPSKYSLEIQ